MGQKRFANLRGSDKNEQKSSPVASPEHLNVRALRGESLQKNTVLSALSPNHDFGSGSSSSEGENEAVCEWISKCASFFVFFTGPPPRQGTITQNQPNAKPSKVTRGRAQSTKVHTILESRSLKNIHPRSFVHRLNRKKHVTVRFFFSF